MSPREDFVLAEYVWIDAGGDLRSKTKVLQGFTKAPTLKDLPEWNYDGSSTGQAPGEDSEVIIRPCAVYRDPFRGEKDVLVMTDTWTPKGFPIPTNTRAPAAKIFAEAPKEAPWFGIEQEYTLFKGGTPLGWPQSSASSGIGGPTSQVGYPGPQGPYYCSAGADVAFGRDISNEHLMVCMLAGLSVSGTNAEVMPGQWEYQVGPCEGIAGGDELMMSRYLLKRVCENHDVVVSFLPKPIAGDWNGAGCHTNFSTKKMRDTSGALEKYILPAIEKLGARHQEHIALYGTGNELRLTGAHETASMEAFSYGVANRGASIRIPNATKQAGKGYFEDRRPASNMDPYVVTAKVFDTAVLNSKFADIFQEYAKAVGLGAAATGQGPVGATQVTQQNSGGGGGGGAEKSKTASASMNGEAAGSNLATGTADLVTPKRSNLRKKKKGCATVM